MHATLLLQKNPQGWFWSLKTRTFDIESNHEVKDANAAVAEGRRVSRKLKINVRKLVIADIDPVPHTNA